ncbi:MAG: gas vesicle protein, partial [Dehalococcoidia bacterium]
MPDLDPIRSEHASLADALDHLLNKGVVLTGDAMLSLAGIDLVYVGLNLVVASVETLRGHGAAGGKPTPPAPL